MPPSPAPRGVPPKWASELAPHARAGGGATATAGAAFDARLDAFLDALHAELLAARAAKDAGDAAAAGPASAAGEAARKDFRERMKAVQKLYAAEGRDFAQVLEERYPGFWKQVDASTATEAGYGDDTIELARGIERLEQTVRDEQSKRDKVREARPPTSERPARSPRSKPKSSSPVPVVLSGKYKTSRHVPSPALSPELRPMAKAPVASPNVTPSISPALGAQRSDNPTGATLQDPELASDDLTSLSALHSDETLCLMQSDIQALKLELLRLQRSKAASGSPRRLPLYMDPSFTLSSVSPTGSSTGRSASVADMGASRAAKDSPTKGAVDALGQPQSRRYVSHLEQMKSRLDALEKKPLGNSNRSRQVSRIGRTRTMTNLYSATHSSKGGAGAHDAPQTTSTSGSSPPRPSATAGSRDENNVPAFVTPPRARKDKDARVQRDQDLLSSNIVKTLGEEDFHSPPESISSSSPSPVAKRTTRARTMASASAQEAENFDPQVAAHSAEAAKGDPSDVQKAGLFSIDAPEELLSRPQSYAAARDIQRYSLKVARRLGPVPGNSDNDGTTKQFGSSDRSRRPFEKGDPAHSTVTKSSASGAVHSPASFAGVTGASSALQVFATSPTSSSMRTGPARSEMRAPGGISQAYEATAAVGVQRTGIHETPSTVDTSNSGGSGGPLVEEIEGDMWVRKGSLWKRWRRRYASIVSHQFFGRVLCLFGYDSSGNVISTKSEIIVLHGALCRSIRDTVDLGGQTQHVFVLRTARDYYMAIDSDTARRAWVRELRQAARSPPAQHSPTSLSSAVAVPPAKEEAQASTAVKTVTQRLPTRKSAMGIGRAVTHHGSQRQPMAQSGGISLMQRPRRGPFRRQANP